MKNWGEMVYLWSLCLICNNNVFVVMQHMLIVCKFLHTIEKKGTKKISFTVGCTWNVCLRYVPLFFPILFFSSFHLCFLWMIIFTLRCLKFSLIYSLLCFEFDVTSIIWLWSAFKFIKILHIFLKLHLLQYGSF